MRLRNRSMAGSSLGPSTPQFQLRLAPAPSQLFSPLASLCFALYETSSFRVKPLWQVTKLMVCSGSRLACPEMSGLPKRRYGIHFTVSLSAFMKLRTSSRNRPFHSFHLPPHH